MQRNYTLTRAAIAVAVRREVGLTKCGSAEMVDAIVEHLCAAMERGENVKITGFGSFLLRDKTERVGRNPKTGEEYAIEPRRVVTFRASSKLKGRIASADEEIAAAEIRSAA